MPAMSFPLGRIQNKISFLQRHSSLLTIGVILGFVIRRSISNYHAYIAMGPGGLPYNIYGWLLSLCFKPFAREKLSTEQYDQDGNKETFLDHEEIKERRGDRPKMSWHIAPSRQLDRYAPLEMGQRLIALFDALAVANLDLVSVVPSRFERIHPALVINESLITPHAPAKKARREICHIHRHKDFSLHAMMSPQDCKTVIEKGWGERHPLSGSHVLPKEFMLLYAPRDDDELAMIARCMCAAIGYMANTHVVKQCDI
ncbi:hypothetical protein OG21DRAFT_1506837 [Imleria badia]|nr:hypothetical protein OG21DRAFT_1506837 [Imleria badia]